MKNIFIVFMLFFASVAYGEIKEFVKEGVVPVPVNQSFDQVVEYTSKRMAREATEEAGVFISSLSSVKNGRLSKDEVATVAGSIAKITVDRREPVVKNGASYASVRVKVLIDTDIVASYLKKIVENEEYKKEAEAMRKKNLELENRLKNANKEEFDKKLSAEAEILASEQKKRYLEIRSMEEKAKAEYLEAERRRMDEEIKTREQLAALKRQFAEEETKARERISAAQTEIVKAELENSAKIAALERNARENKASWLALSDITAEAAEKEATEVRSKIAYLKKEFNEKLDSNAKRLEKVYNDEIASVENRKFAEPVPVKGEWDTTEEYNKLKSDYYKRKQTFETSKNSTVKELKLRKEQALQDMRLSGEEIMQDSIAPLVDRLKRHSAGRYVSIKEEYAAISFGEKDVDNKKLPFTLKYDGKSYNFVYVFDSLNEFRATYETRSLFYAVPTFEIEPYKTGARKFLNGFTVMHLGNDKKVWFKVAEGNPFPEVKEKEDRETAKAEKENEEIRKALREAEKELEKEKEEAARALRKAQKEREKLERARYYARFPDVAMGGGTCYLFPRYASEEDFNSWIDILYWRFHFNKFRQYGFAYFVSTSLAVMNRQDSYNYEDSGGIFLGGGIEFYPLEWFYLTAEAGGFADPEGNLATPVKFGAGIRFGDHSASFRLEAVYQPTLYTKNGKLPAAMGVRIGFGRF